MKVNKKATNTPIRTPSKDGVEAFKKSPIQELCDRVLTCFYGEEKGYETGTQATNELTQLIQLVAAEDPIFIAKLAILARETFHLRTVPQIIAVELAKVHKGDSMVSTLLNRIILRPDEMSDVLAYYINRYGTVTPTIQGRSLHKNKAIPAQIRKGIAKALLKFDEYQLSKYKGNSKQVKLADVIKLIHPTPKNPEQYALWGRVLSNELVVANTWETAISGAGQKAKSEDGTVDTEKVETLKKEVWESMILNKELGYMAALRNIRNVIQSNVSKEAHNKLQEHIGNEKAVMNSKQLPFRFYSAYKALENESGLDPFVVKGYKQALNTALYHSGKNFPKISGRSAIVCDLSGSMDWKTISAKSGIKLRELAATLTAIAPQFCEDSISIGFATQVVLIDTIDDPKRTLDDVKKILGTHLGGGTNTAGVLELLLSKKLKVDNILIFTDGQYNVGSYETLEKQYRKTINPDVVVYNIDLAGYGATQHDPRNPLNVFMSGWSDNLLRFIAQRHEYKNGIVDMVNAVEFSL